jgi:hypothetical protein
VKPRQLPSPQGGRCQFQIDVNRRQIDGISVAFMKVPLWMRLRKASVSRYGGFFMGSPAGSKTSQERQRRDLELWFWAIREGIQTAREALVLILVAVLVLFIVFVLLEGHAVMATELLRALRGSSLLP